MSMGFWGRFGAIMAAAFGGAGLYFESTPMLIVATIAATSTAISWMRWTAPHDHWRQFRRRRPWDP